MKKCLCLLLTLLMLPLVARGEEAPIPISTVEELLAMTHDPSGSYILMEDLDMTGVEWPSPDFSGSFDGNGHAILNLTLSCTGTQSQTCYDGNCIGYSAEYCGFFASVIGGEVKNLRLLNVRGVLEADCPVFLGGITGYMEGSLLSGCQVTGCLELRAHQGMFGMGGLAGYGWGAMENCTADVTLICVDTDADTLDEQFLGGAYGAGFISVENCDIRLDGYISEHGYVHSGGVVGMYLAYPADACGTARIAHTRVAGKITFFEHNIHRRAYCRALIGETLYSYGKLEGNTTDFTRDERQDYTRELRPCTCEDPDYTETVILSGCDSYGYTEFTCNGCGYSYTDRYTLFSHNVAYAVTYPADEEREGLMTGICRDCGAEFTQSIPRLETVPTSAPTEPATSEETQTAPAEGEEDRGQGRGVLPLGIATGVAVAAFLLLRPRRKAGKFQR